MPEVTVTFKLERDPDSGPEVAPSELLEAVGAALDGQMVEAEHDKGVTVYTVTDWDTP